jgi:hypothetical protein
MAEIKGIEDFESSALQTIGLAVEDLGPRKYRNTFQVVDLTLVPRLSTILVLTPHLLIQFAIISPAGPAPMMRTSTSESACRGAIVEAGDTSSDGQEKENWRTEMTVGNSSLTLAEKKKKSLEQRDQRRETQPKEDK